MKRVVLPLLGLVVLVATVAQVKAMRTARESVTPPPAQSRRGSVSAEGRVVAYPGAEVTIGSDVAGTIDRVLVEEKDVVKKGDVLVVVRADDTRASIAEARARVAEEEADIRLQELEVERTRNLWKEDVGTKQAWERAERDLEAARARRASVLAEVRQLEAVLAKTVITSPIDGTVITRSAHAGESIAAGTPLITVADLTRTRVEAEVDEFDSGRVAVGAAAVVTAEGLDGRWRAHVEEVPDAVVYRRLKPQDASKPSDTRVLLVKLALDERTPLKLGQRVEIELGVR